MQKKGKRKKDAEERKEKGRCRRKIRERKRKEEKEGWMRGCKMDEKEGE